MRPTGSMARDAGESLFVDLLSAQAAGRTASAHDQEGVAQHYPASKG